MVNARNPLSVRALLGTLNGLVGEVQATPTANTLLARVKAIADLLPGLGQKTGANSMSIVPATDAGMATSGNQTAAKTVLDAIAAKGTPFEVSASFTRPANTTARVAGGALTDSTSAPTVMQFTIPGAVAGQTILIQNVQVVVGSKWSAPPIMLAWLSPVTFTATNDNSELSIADAVAEDIQTIDLSAGYSTALNARCQPEAGFTHVLMKLAAADTKLYGTLSMRNTPTPGSADKILVKLRGLLL